MDRIKKINVVKIIRENVGISVFTIFMAGYYGWRMFALEPWYDELYTYYSFISRGPIYAAIHWPVPNNHVMFSVISSFLNIFGNAYISLRGISFLASVGNLILIYFLSRKFMNKALSLGCAAVYSGFYLVNFLSIQGRGYTLGISFYLIAILMLYKICVEKKDTLLYYGIFSLCLTWGLYTITSNVYWVLPVCFTGGFCLLFQKEIKILSHLIISSVIAALHTLGLYSIIWLAIGSNLLSKTPDSGFYGIYQVNIIFAAPLKALKTGMDYMLDSPYVQSIDRGEMLSSFGSWLVSLMNVFVNNHGKIVVGTLVAAMAGCVLLAKKNYDIRNDKRYFLYVYIGTSLFITPLILIVQSVLPYQRVFTYFGVVLTFIALGIVSEWIKEKGTKVICGVCVVGCIMQIFSGYYMAPYAGREVEIKEIWEQSGIEECPNGICFMDDFQKYVLQFYWDYRPTESYQEEARYIIMPKEVMDEEYKAKSWPILFTYDEVNWDTLKECKVVTETDSYILYEREVTE